MYAQAGLSLCWSHIPHCWKSHVAAQLTVTSIAAVTPTVINFKKVQVLIIHLQLFTVTDTAVDCSLVRVDTN